MRVFLIIFFLLINAAIAAEGRLDSTTLTAIKQSLAFIKLPQSTGSGFLLKTVGSNGYVVTNSHVVMEAINNQRISISVILGSTLPTERKFSATIKSFDLSADLAILGIEGENLPKPFAISTAKIEETMSVWVVGFPFGEMLSVGANNPAPTISPTQVSSLRKTPAGTIEVIQTNGGINPGNSGGPIVDSSGRLIAISVAKVSGSEIGFGIPSSELEDMLAGRLTFGEAVLSSETSGAVIAINVNAADPFNAVTRVVALVAPSSQCTEEVKRGKDGRVSAPITTGMTEFTLTYKDQKAVGTAKMVLPKNGGQEFTVQFRVSRKDGTSHYTNVIRSKSKSGLPFASSSGAGSGRRNPGSEPKPVAVQSSWTPPKVDIIVPPTPVFVEGRTERTEQGRSFTAVTAEGTIPDLGKEVLTIAANPSGREIYVLHRNDAAVVIVEPETWKTLTELAVPEFPVSVWADSEIIAVACDKSRVVSLIDTKKRAIIASGSLPDNSKYRPSRIVGRAPDGTIMSLWRLEGGTWRDCALVHTGLDGKSRIMIEGEAIYWATWMLNGTGILAQSDFSHGPSGTIDLAFPQGPKNTAELHYNTLFGNEGFHTDTGKCFASSDRRSYVFVRNRNTNNYKDQIPWTYLISPDLDAIRMDFPGAAILEIPEQRQFISVGYEKTDGSNALGRCHYISSTDGCVIRSINLKPPPRKGNNSPHNVFGTRPYSDAVFIPGYEILLVPGGENNPLPSTYFAFRCGPVKNTVQAGPSVTAGNDPPATAKVGDSLRYAPTLEGAKNPSSFRLKRELSGMAIDSKTGVFTWKPGPEHVGRWTVTILATVAGEERTIISWTIEVR